MSLRPLANSQKLCLLLGTDSAISRNGGAGTQEPGPREAICEKKRSVIDCMQMQRCCFHQGIRGMTFEDPGPWCCSIKVHSYGTETLSLKLLVLCLCKLTFPSLLYDPVVRFFNGPPKARKWEKKSIKPEWYREDGGVKYSPTPDWGCQMRSLATISICNKGMVQNTAFVVRAISCYHGAPNRWRKKKHGGKVGYSFSHFIWLITTHNRLRCSAFRSQCTIQFRNCNLS